MGAFYKIDRYVITGINLLTKKLIWIVLDSISSNDDDDDVEKWTHQMLRNKFFLTAIAINLHCVEEKKWCRNYHEIISSNISNWLFIGQSIQLISANQSRQFLPFSKWSLDGHFQLFGSHWFDSFMFDKIKKKIVFFFGGI